MLLVIRHARSRRHGQVIEPLGTVTPWFAGAVQVAGVFETLHFSKAQSLARREDVHHEGIQEGVTGELFEMRVK